jgi:hypothetical protein
MYAGVSPAKKISAGFDKTGALTCAATVIQNIWKQLQSIAPVSSEDQVSARASATFPPKPVICMRLIRVTIGGPLSSLRG